MSGVSLAVAPSNETTTTTTTTDHRGQPPQQAAVGGIMGSLRVIELQLVAFIMVFSASGLVPLFDLAFPAFTTIYLLLLSRLAFPKTTTTTTTSLYKSEDTIFEGSRLFRAYVILGTSIGLFLPLAYVLGGFARGDEHALQSATPHLFLLSCQILTENVISGLSLFSAPVRALVPMLYTVRRIFVILDWVQDVWLNKSLSPNAEIKDVAWFWFGRVLALANLAYFSINLFGFLIPRFLPRAFDHYFRERNEIQRKMGEDKKQFVVQTPQSPADKKSN
ncbi:hypothetical protein OSB04_009026 [Centaurea solstitialis]|uniref:DUF7733 domain-containing protein n=1 Tax=Centaurea solstitialis TaxID=347529 RepID=A0AA38U0L7_9ASTR|nr:hypothetical protein OSB04_009026 [Centaurea solstitialis]